MGDVQITEVDTTDEARLRAWWEVGAAASAERPFDAWPVWEVSRVTLPRPRSDVRTVLTLAVDGDRVVGAGLLVLLLLDNTHLVEITAYVAPADRRRGVGALVVADLEARARAGGRSTALSTVFAPLAAESPGSSFATALGYPVASAEETKLLDLTTAPHSWSDLERRAEASRGDHRVEVVEGATPDAWVEDFCGLLTRFVELVPTGDLDLREESWTPQRLRDDEARVAAVGRVAITTYAVAPDGHLCGFSDLRVDRADPRLASVGGTMVLPEHRGHALGLAMKLAGHRRLLELFPECAAVMTGNAGVNAAMNAVNEAMGYVVVERSLDVQKVLSEG